MAIVGQISHCRGHRASMKRIETQIDVRADAHTVWSVLTDFPRYGDWNPFVPSIEGVARDGAKLRVRVAPPGGACATLRPRIVCCRPERELCWVGRVLLPGLFDGTHQFRIAATGSGVRFYQCESFSGLGATLLGKEQLACLKAGFAAMNEALRQRAEALAAEQPQRAVA